MFIFLSYPNIRFGFLPDLHDTDSETDSNDHGNFDASEGDERDAAEQIKDELADLNNVDTFSSKLIRAGTKCSFSEIAASFNAPIPKVPFSLLCLFIITF